MKHTKQPKPSGQECKYCNGMGKYEIAGCVYTCSCKQPPPPPSLPNRSEKEREYKCELCELPDFLCILICKASEGKEDEIIKNRERTIKYIKSLRHQYAEELKGGIKKMEVDSNGRIKGQKAVTGNQVVALNSWKSYNQALQNVLSLLERKGEK